ncbi:MAG: hypothetical protein HXY30_03595 [Pseudorhodoplanes sp.]|nr:hypothetical protein [Pseudorhodoplanes sp.]
MPANVADIVDLSFANRAPPRDRRIPHSAAYQGGGGMLHCGAFSPAGIRRICLSRSRAMRRIIEANINRFRLLLETETDAAKRAMVSRLLAEEEAKLDDRAKPGEKQA